MQLKTQKGLSLVELMIAMTLAVVLTAAVVNIYLSSQRTYTVLNGQTTMQENGRFAVDFIRQELQKAGYRTYSYQTDAEQEIWSNGQRLPQPEQVRNNSFEETFPARAPFAAGQVVAGGSNTAGNAMPNTDFLTVRYQRADDGTLYDCLGATIPRRPDNEIRIVTARFFVSANSELMCQVSFDNEAPQAPVALVGGVENLQVRFGIGRNGNFQGYVEAPAVSQDVYAVELALLARSDHETTSQSSTATFSLLDNTVGPFADRRLRQVFSQTVKLRNVPNIAMSHSQ